MILLAGLEFTGSRRVDAGPVSCSRVISEIDRAVSRRGHREPELKRIARRLGVEPSWVQRCAQAYGRNIKGKSVSEDDTRESDEARWEDPQHEERAREDGEAPIPTPEPERRGKDKLWPDPWADEFDPNKGINPP